MRGKSGRKRAVGAGSATSESKRSKRSGKDVLEEAPPPPSCNSAESVLSSIEIKINRSPILVLWATVRCFVADQML